MNIDDEYFSIESEVIDSIEDIKEVIFNEDMSECLIGDTIEWDKGISVVNLCRTTNIHEIVKNKKKLVRLVILIDKKKRLKVALVVCSILGIVTNSEEGRSLINHLYGIKNARLSKFDITKVFIT